MRQGKDIKLRIKELRVSNKTSFTIFSVIINWSYILNTKKFFFAYVIPSHIGTDVRAFKLNLFGDGNVTWLLKVNLKGYGVDHLKCTISCLG